MAMKLSESGHRPETRIVDAHAEMFGLPAAILVAEIQAREIAVNRHCHIDADGRDWHRLPYDFLATHKSFAISSMLEYLNLLEYLDEKEILCFTYDSAGTEWVHLRRGNLREAEEIWIGRRRKVYLAKVASLDLAGELEMAL